MSMGVQVDDNVGSRVIRIHSLELSLSSQESYAFTRRTPIHMLNHMHSCQPSMLSKPNKHISIRIFFV